MIASNTLWIFGDSNCLPYSLSKKNEGWDIIVATELQATLKNFAKMSTDNFYIFNCLLDNLKNIQDEDTIIIGWTHPYRKTFVYDSLRHEHLLENSMVYDTSNNKFLRSTGNIPSAHAKWPSMNKVDSGIPYYDDWFKNYFSETEQKTNSQSYMLAAQQLLNNKKYLPFYFSHESVDGFVVRNREMCILDFIKENNVQISNNDAHMTSKGHELWSKEILIDLEQRNGTHG